MKTYMKFCEMSALRRVFYSLALFRFYTTNQKYLSKMCRSRCLTCSTAHSHDNNMIRCSERCLKDQALPAASIRKNKSTN